MITSKQLSLWIGLICFSFFTLKAQEIPLKEHPRPDFERSDWQNLNGQWDFEFDAEDVGMAENWANGNKAFNRKIMVPFPWGSALSLQKDEADIGWYQREINVGEDWKGRRTFLTIGASDWETTVWLDGKEIGSHKGGYIPFSFELTEHIKYGQNQKLVIRADDARRAFTLYGKQGYGNARGIWQTVYLEARGSNYIDALHFTPDIESGNVLATVYLPEDAPQELKVDISIQREDGPINHSGTIAKGAHKASFLINIPEARLWSLKDPYLYTATAKMGNDEVHSYFGMRKISAVNLPGTDYPYIALNNEPVYVQLALDQSYHPEGFYTFPSDQFMKEEIERSLSIGLNGIRTHIKVEVPRKLYWADKLGLLVMEDLPNSWGEPDEKMQAESEYTLREMIKRDYNHPSIFSWVVFNETWGLKTKVGGPDSKNTAYLPSTQNWVASMYYLAKSLDMTRLVEDNSICCGYGHTETDINSWHVYLPGYAWEDHLKNLTDNTYPGSQFDFEDGFTQGNQPNINSECGNVWGYEGSAGDVDWSWDYHRMINTFRKYPKVGGWLYTEHHDVINEWNGYWRFDRSEKETGLGEILPGMSLNDLHADVYLSTGVDISRSVEGGETVEVPLYLSVMTGEDLGENLKINYSLSTTNYIGETEKNLVSSMEVPYVPWMQEVLSPLLITVPDLSGVSLLAFEVTTAEGKVLSRNFMHFIISSSQKIEKVDVLSKAAKDYATAEFSKKSWGVMKGKKINGAGKGYIEYNIDVPGDFNLGRVGEVYFLAELSAKELFVKDQEEYDRNQDFMRGSLVANSSNPNSYPMTDETMFPSRIKVSVNGFNSLTTTLADDPADHRGVLSWHNQLQDRKLREAGSYGYLVKVPMRRSVLRNAVRADGKITIRIETEGEGGVAVYGKDFGRYPVDPSLVVIRR